MERQPVTSELILSQAEQLLGMALTPERATELAREVQKLNDAVRDASEHIDFNDDPARFAATLVALKGGKR